MPLSYEKLCSIAGVNPASGNILRYDPNQPRHPAGVSEGGQWEGGTGGMAPDKGGGSGGVYLPKVPKHGPFPKMSFKLPTMPMKKSVKKAGGFAANGMNVTDAGIFGERAAAAFGLKRLHADTGDQRSSFDATLKSDPSWVFEVKANYVEGHEYKTKMGRDEFSKLDRAREQGKKVGIMLLIVHTKNRTVEGYFMKGVENGTLVAESGKVNGLNKFVFIGKKKF